MDQTSSAVVASGASDAQGAVDGASGQNQGTGNGTAVVERQAARVAPESGTAGETTTPAPTTTQQPGETLESYKARYSGLQGVYSQEKAQAAARLQAADQARQAAETRAQQAEAAAWDLQWRLQGLSPEQIRDNKQVLAERQRLASEKTALATERQRMQDERTAFRQATEGPARQIVADRIAREEGVPVERIAHLSHPDLMRELAREIRGLQKQSTVSQRRAAGTDRAESSGGGGIDVSTMSAHDKIKLGLKQHHAANARR